MGKYLHSYVELRTPRVDTCTNSSTSHFERFLLLGTDVG
jgi:hypothetical protein